MKLTSLYWLGLIYGIPVRHEAVFETDGNRYEINDYGAESWEKGDIDAMDIGTGTGTGADTGTDTGTALVKIIDGSPSKYPVVMWHGLNDRYDSDRAVETENYIKHLYPGVTVYRVRLDDNPSKDRDASLYGDINVQLQRICDVVSGMPELEGGFDAIGFSQGGLFLRGLLETCQGVKIHNLITFGLPHMGVMDLPVCNGFFCKGHGDAMLHRVWSPIVQHSIVPAQYFRNPYDMEKYIKYSNFLPIINNERESDDNNWRKEKLLLVNKLVIYMFLQDTTVVPKTSAHFGDIDIETGQVIHLRDTDMYKSDTIGLKTLDERDGIIFKQIDGPHMQIPDAVLSECIDSYLGEAR